MTLGEARELLRSSFLETLPALAVAPRLREAVRLDGRTLHIAGNRYPLSEGHTVRVVSLGKAAIPMAHSLAEILPGVRLRGVVAAPDLPPASLEAFEYFAGGHPLPNGQSWQAAESALALLGLQSAQPDDLVLFLISGGGSALCDKPLHPSLSLDDLRAFHQVLVACGAPIEDVNALRKHLSAVKGGRLAERAAPASQVTLYVSDVPEHLPSAVASGPSMPDETTVEDCLRIAKQYALLEKLPVPGSPCSTVRSLFESGALAETPKPGSACFSRSRYHCLLSNSNAVSAFAQLLRSQGVHVEVEDGCDGWEYRRAADYLLSQLGRLHRDDPVRPAAILSGGELSCPVPGAALDPSRDRKEAVALVPSRHDVQAANPPPDREGADSVVSRSGGSHGTDFVPWAFPVGIGGRNQAFALYCATKIAGKRIVVLSAGTDGIDGNSPAAGALADGSTTGRAAALKLDPEYFLQSFDSHSFFARLGDAIHTGPTATNVRDVRVVLAYG
jgi:hydroxypyruvate reductase